MKNLEKFQNENKVKLLKKIAELKPKHQAIFDMYHNQGLTYEQIGKRLGMTKQAIHQQYHVLIRQLTKKMNDLQ